MADLRFGVYEHKLVYDTDKLGKQPPLTGPERNATWQLPTAWNSGAANTAYPVEPGSIAFLSEPVKGVPLRGGCRLPLAQNLRAAILYYE